MDSDESHVIPPLGKEHHVWHIPEDAPVSRSRRSRGNGEYESTIPISLADLRFVFPPSCLRIVRRHHVRWRLSTPMLLRNWGRVAMCLVQ